jgi:hypothetical protein
MLNVTELFSKAILLAIFVYGDCMAVCWILYTCQQWVVAEIAKSTHVKGVHIYYIYTKVCPVLNLII